MVLKLKPPSDSSTSSLRSSVTRIVTRNGYGQLPQKVLINIFQYFDEEDLRLNIIPVCQQWRAAAEQPQLWKVLKFSGLKTSTSVINNKIWQYNLADTIIVNNIKAPVPVLRQICRCTKNLISLTLRHCSEISEDSLRHLIVSCKSLKSLDLKGTPFQSLIFCEELSSADSLSSVNFSDNKYMTVAHVASIVVNCHRLDSFHLSTFQPINKIYLADADIKFIFSHTNYQLQSLTLDCSSLTSATFGVILKCKNLRYLSLNYAYNFEGKDFETLWKFLGKLKVLKVRFGHQICDHHVNNLFEKGKNILSQLEIIDFTGCSKLSTFGLKSLALSCSNLKTLIVRNCKNVLTLSSVFSECPYLEILNVAFCKRLQVHEKCSAPNLKELFVSDGKRLKSFANDLKATNNNLLLRMCESEYNKIYKKIYNWALFLSSELINIYLT